MNKLNFGDIVGSKGEFYDSKIAVKLKEVNVDKIVVSNKVKVNDIISKVFIGDIIDDNTVPLCLLLNQMSGWIK